MSAMTLTDFLLARIIEDEAAARVATGTRWNSVGDTPEDDDHCGSIYADGDWDSWVVNWDGGPSNGDHVARWDPARVLAECEAKRRIIASVQDHRDGEWEDDPIHELVLTALAFPYADHPDYDLEWTS